MPKQFNSQGGALPILILLAAAGLLIFLFISNTAGFKDKLFSKLFPKPPSHAQEVKPESVPDEILLKFKPGVLDKDKDTVRSLYGLNKLDEIKQIDVERGKVPAEAKDKIIEALKKNPQVEFAEPNFILKATLTPNDLYYTLGRQWAPPKINAPAAWDITTGASSAIIAILDSGVNYNHEDLVGKFIGNPALDDYGHGTRVAGVAGAIGNNTKGVAGICWLCPMLSIKVLDSTGSGTTSGAANGIVQAANAGAKVINMSFGSYTFNQTMQDATNYAWGTGVVLIGGAGNNNSNAKFYPAANDNVIAIGATNSSDILWVFSASPGTGSNYGSWVDVVAPGDTIWSTNMGGSYDSQDGTSFATPHVSGLAGLILSVKPTLTNQQVVDIITSTAKDLGDPGKDDTYGYGRIDAYAAVSCAKNGVFPCPNSNPLPSVTPSPSPTPTPIPAFSDTTSPTVSITNPLNGSTVKANSKVNITASASDNISVTKVEFYIGTSLKCSILSGPYFCIWSVPGKKNSSYTIQAKAYDGANNTNTSTVTIKAQ